jgi:hypothetical protein
MLQNESFLERHEILYSGRWRGFYQQQGLVQTVSFAEKEPMALEAL